MRADTHEQVLTMVWKLKTLLHMAADVHYLLFQRLKNLFQCSKGVPSARGKADSDLRPVDPLDWVRRRFGIGTLVGGCAF